MRRHASAVIGLLRCHTCRGYVALGTCICANKQKDKQNEKGNDLVSTPSSRPSTKQSLIGAL